MPGVPITVCVQGQSEEWITTKCNCTKNEHTNQDHTPGKINGMISVDLPGGDILQNEGKMKKYSEEYKKQFNSDRIRLKNFIFQHAAEIHPITQKSFWDALKSFCNSVFGWLFGTFLSSFGILIKKVLMEVFKLNEADAEKIAKEGDKLWCIYCKKNKLQRQFEF